MRISTKVIVLFAAVSAVITACGGDEGEPTYVSQRYSQPAPTATSSYRYPQQYSGQQGGTRYSPPTQQPYADTFFRDYGVNPAVSTQDQQFSTFGMDVDTASYTISRSYLEDGHMPPVDAVRVEEFVNYFDGDYPSPDHSLRVYLDGARTVFGDDGYLLRVGVAAREIAEEDRRPVVLIFVIDVSGSMNIDNRLGLAKRSLERLVDNMGPEDKVGIITYGSTARKLLSPTSNKGRILDVVNGLKTGGSTNAEAGLLMGYDMASDAFDETRNNRVVLISDGVANVGRTSADSIRRRVEREANRSITLTAIGVGMANYNDVLMEQLADTGDGNYYYIDTDAEARRLFTRDLVGLLEPVAKDAKIQVEFNPAVVESFRLIGYENRGLETEDFRDNSVDAGEVGAGHTVTALYELHLKDGAWGGAATAFIRYEDVESGEIVEHSREITVEDLDGSLDSASARFRFTASVAEFAEVLRESYWARGVSLRDVQRVADDALDDMNYGLREDEFMWLVDTAIQLER